MRRAAAVLALSLAAIVPLSAADAAKAPVLQVREVSVQNTYPTGKDADFTLRCPSGWRATGFGYGAGGMDLYYADTDGTGRGYSFLADTPTYSDGTPIEAPSDGWGLNATVICARGSGPLKVRGHRVDLARIKREHDALTGRRP